MIYTYTTNFLEFTHALLNMYVFYFTFTPTQGKYKRIWLNLHIFKFLFFDKLNVNELGNEK